MASGLKTNLIISSMESIVLDIFDSAKKARDPLIIDPVTPGALYDSGCLFGVRGSLIRLISMLNAK